MLSRSIWRFLKLSEMACQSSTSTRMGKVGLLEGLLQAAESPPIQRPLTTDGQVEVGVVLGCPHSARAEGPHLAFRYMLCEDGLDRLKVVWVQVNRVDYSQASPVIAV